ncbi:MAG: tRNA lysidine(34) synthetase TilS [Clostridiaceae bacterium]|jgi:tRNA(Ile)-lysidine synthase|nr:tRNA lysidine(34) synthetase TilS [Clostridiaceae bacterium]
MKIPRVVFRLFETISDTCEREDLIPHESLVLAGVSGGVDSMFLLAFLQFYRAKTPFDLVACHLNHGIREREADFDEELVTSYCQSHGIPLISVKVRVPDYAKERKIGLEEAGRLLRRQAFEETAARRLEQKNYPGGFRIALAHHLDDRAESILMHLGRGSGLQGLVGIRYLDDPYIRPLLDVRNRELVEAARALDLPWREDASNLSREFLRNRIRLDLMPCWQEVLGYDPAPLLVRLGDLAQGDDRALSDLASENLARLCLPDGSLSLAGLVTQPQALVSRILNQYYDRTESASLSHAQLEALVELLGAVSFGKKKEARLSLPGGITALLRDGRLWLQKESVKEDRGDPEESGGK